MANISLLRNRPFSEKYLPMSGTVRYFLASGKINRWTFWNLIKQYEKLTFGLRLVLMAIPIDLSQIYGNSLGSPFLPLQLLVWKQIIYQTFLRQQLLR
jgi:hypothetical protein